MKILVTGGLGYIGSALLPHLAECYPQAQLIVMDNLSAGAKAMDNVSDYTFIRADIRDFDFNTLGLSRTDIVIHLAALSSPAESFNSPAAYRVVNYEGAVRMARVCAEARSAFFFPSSTSVYGRTDGKCITNSKTFLKPSTPYAKYKLMAERTIAKLPDLRYTIVRFGTIYGNAAGNRFQTAVNRFCQQATAGRPIKIWRTALHQMRPYLDIKDAVKVILFLIKRKEFHRKIFNAATDHFSASDIVRMILEQIPGAKWKITESEAMNRFSYRVSTKKLENLGFQFRGSITEAIAEMVRFCAESHANAPEAALLKEAANAP